MTRLRFNAAKATEAAALLLKLHGGTISHLKLIKLLYFADREALLRWGRAITTDRYLSMKYGPVLSQVLDLVNYGDALSATPYWDKFISARGNHNVSLLTDPPEEELSPAEDHLLREIFAVYGRKSQWELVELAHQLPEWQDPHGGAIPISYRDILLAGGKSEAEADEIESEIQHLAEVEDLLAPI